MKTYWDYSEKERSEMMEEQVRSLLDVELMTKGVKKVEAPILKPIQSVKVATEIWFEVNGAFFKSAELAQQFLALDPRKSTYEYSCGYDYRYACVIEPKIEQTQLYSRQELLNLATILQENKAAKDYNEQATTEYEKQKKETDKVLEGVWSNWYECRKEAAEHKKLRDTYDEYVTLTKGDIALAETFLKKVYTEEEVQATREWFKE